MATDNKEPLFLYRFSKRLVAVALLFCLSFAGCSSTYQVRLRSPWRAPYSAEQSSILDEAGISKRTQLTLRTYDLEKTAQKSLAEAFRAIEAEIRRSPTLDLVFAAAELAHLNAEKERKKYIQTTEPTIYYYASAKYAFGYLFDPRFSNRRNRYDPHFRSACTLYNDAVEQILRSFSEGKAIDLSSDRGFYLYGSPKNERVASLQTVSCSEQWDVNDLEPFRFASDYEIKGLTNQYRQYGLGVPLLAKQKPGTKKNRTTKYTTDNLCFPVTAILRFLPLSHPQNIDAVIELYDPLTASSVEFLRHNVPLESDLTTPIAFSISDPRIAQASTVGLLRSDLFLKPISEVLGKKSSKDESLSVGGTDFDRKTIKGLYMMQPHEAGKIPVIFVHGLWSSPVAWMEMFNALRSEPDLRNRYEFYFYFYPTGQPFWVSAAQFRDDLEEFRQTFDPKHRDPVFDNIVLVGHSMGGLISHLQTLDSGEEFWDLVSDAPPETVLSAKPPEVRREIEKWFFFKANPSIRRVITIATPHHGSRASNGLTQWLGHKIITLPKNVQEAAASLTQDNLLEENSLLNVKTSIASFDPDLPVFDAMKRQRQYSTALYHNIVGQVEQNALMKKILPPNDGVVRTESAALENSVSEITVRCEHSAMPSHPKTILEVRRILLEYR